MCGWQLKTLVVCLPSGCYCFYQRVALPAITVRGAALHTMNVQPRMTVANHCTATLSQLLYNYRQIP
jgi:hypothetical protein